MQRPAHNGVPAWLGFTFNYTTVSDLDAAADAIAITSLEP